MAAAELQVLQQEGEMWFSLPPLSWIQCNSYFSPSQDLLQR